MSTLKVVNPDNVGLVVDMNPEPGTAVAPKSQHRADDRRARPQHDHHVDHDHHASRAVTAALARWYAAHGRHELPWRATRDRWTILVSEVMLHQTQVPRVAAVFDAFMREFPTPTAMADAGVGRGDHARGAASGIRAGLVGCGKHRSSSPPTAGPPTSAPCPASAATPRPRSPRRPTTPR